jgi:hypothetical protein
MIRIRYRDSNELSPGLHVTAERRGHRTTVYLLAGMTSAERRSALRRLRLTARMGHCPRLPAGQLAFALFTDRIRTGIGRVGAVLRLHPAGSTVPIMVLSGGAIAFLLLSTVSIHVMHSRANQPNAGGPAASASAISFDRGSQGRSPGPRGRGSQGNPGDPGGPASPDSVSRESDTWQLTQLSGAPVTTSPALAAGDGGAGASIGSGGTGSGGTGSGGTGSSSSATNSGSKSSGGGTTLSASADQSPVTPQQTTPGTTPATSGAAPAPAATVPAPAPAATVPAAAPAAAPTAAPATASPGSSSDRSNGACVNVGRLRVCLDI